jgi:alanine racemase
MAVATESPSQVWYERWVGRATRAEIDLEAVRENIQALKARVGANVRLCPAVKANAYGHGAVAVANAVLDAGADYLAVSCVDEGIQLRNAGITAPVLVMGFAEPSEMARAAWDRLTLTINNEQQVEALTKFCVGLGVPARVHLKVDTGMNRYGTDCSSLMKVAQMLGRCRLLEIEGLYTHFARSDEADKSCTFGQMEVFLQSRERLRKAGFAFPICHAANSAAIIDCSETHLDMVRPGIAIYGVYPSNDVSRSVPLRPALSLKSQVARVHTLRAGDGVSYGHTFVAKGAAKVALVPVGYGDGFHRCLSNRAEVLIRGSRARIAGLICMDQIVVDVSHLDIVEVGDEVVLIGRQGNEQITVEELAGLAGTNPHEITTSISSRVPRLYLRNGRLVAYTNLNSAEALTRV